MQEPELNKLYSPSFWSKRFSSAEEVIQHHLKFIEKAGVDTRNEIPSHLNVPYGTSKRQKIDIFGTDLKDTAPLFIFIHGGYWHMKEITKASYHFIAKNLYKNGIKSIFIGYDLCPDVTMFEIVSQIENATRKCLEYAKEKKSSGLFFMGHSAGAHLIASLFTKTILKEEKSLIKGAILASGIFDLLPVLKTEYNEPLKLDERMAYQLSPVKSDIGSDLSASVLVIVGENESPEFVKQSEEFSEKLKKAGVEYEFFVVPNVDHYDIIEKLYEENYSIVQKIVKMAQ